MMQAAANQLRVRGALFDEVPALGEVWLELMRLHENHDVRFALSPDALGRWHALAEEMIGREDGFVFVAEIGPQIVGFCLGWLARNPPIYRVADVGFVSEIAVRRPWRRRGVGRALMDEARRWFAQRDLKEFQLSTAVWNEGAQAFWRSLGGAPLLVRYRFET